MVDNAPEVEESGDVAFGALSGHQKPRGVIGTPINSAGQHSNAMGWNGDPHERTMGQCGKRPRSVLHGLKFDSLLRHLLALFSRLEN